MMIPGTQIDLIRHGEPLGGRMIRGNGRDDPLSALGWRQLRERVADLGPWDQVVSSPMRRCRDFAVAYANERELPWSIEPDLREIGMGSWEGLRHEEVAQGAPDHFQRFRADPLAVRPPGGESLQALRSRVAAVHDRLLRRHAGERLLVVCHAGVCRALLSHLLDADLGDCFHLRIDYGTLLRIQHAAEGVSVHTPCPSEK